MKKRNPLPEILAATPDNLTVLDSTLIDRFTAIILSCTNKIVNNKCVLFILKELETAGYIYFYPVQAEVPGDIFLIRKK